MKKLLLMSGLLAAFAANAMAADMQLKAPVTALAPAYSWTGFYLGGNAGGAWGSFDPSTSTVFSPSGIFAPSSVPAINSAGVQSISPSGFTGGFETGVNWQSGNFVVGLEGDIESFRLSGNATSGPITYPCCAASNFTVTSNASTSWLATARGRLGVAASNWLFFATGGVAFTNLEGNFTFIDTFYPSAEAVSFSNTKTGYAVGGGVEAGLSGGWSVKAEYLYVSFGTVTATGFDVAPGLAGITAGALKNPFTHSIDLNAHIGRFGLNYRF